MLRVRRSESEQTPSAGSASGSVSCVGPVHGKVPPGSDIFSPNDFSPGYYLVRIRIRIRIGGLRLRVRVKFSLGVRVSGMITVRVDVGVRVRVRVSNLLIRVSASLGS